MPDDNAEERRARRKKPRRSSFLCVADSFPPPASANESGLVPIPERRTTPLDLPPERIREIHLAGYEDKGAYLIDAHNNRVSDAVWEVFCEVIARMPDVPVLIEWDNDIPELEVLLDEALRAETFRSTSVERALEEVQ